MTCIAHVDLRDACCTCMIMLLVLSSQTTIELASVNLFDESRWYPLHNKDAMAAAARCVSIPLVDPLGQRCKVYE